MADDLISSMVDRIKSYEAALGTGLDYVTGGIPHKENYLEARAPTQNNIQEFLTDFITHYRKLPSELPDQIREAYAYLKARYPRYTGQVPAEFPTTLPDNAYGQYLPESKKAQIARIVKNNFGANVIPSSGKLAETITHEMTHARQANRLGSPEAFTDAYKAAGNDALTGQIPMDIPISTWGTNPKYWGNQMEVLARQGGRTARYGFGNFEQALPQLTEQLHPQQQLNYGILRDILQNKAPMSNPWMQLNIK